MLRAEALQLVEENVKKENLVKHMLAVEAIMAGCANLLGEDAEKWRLTGLLHDIDFGKLDYHDPETAKRHGLVSAEILDGKVSEEIIDCIKTHNFENLGLQPSTKMDYCLIAADAISGLVIACALVMPSKRLAEVKPDSIKKRFKEKDFARNCSREHMMFCEKAGISFDKFCEIALTALQGIATDLGL